MLIYKQHNKHANRNHKTTISNYFFHTYRTRLIRFILIYDVSVKSIIYDILRMCMFDNQNTVEVSVVSSGNAKSTASSSLTGISSFGAVNLSTRSGIKSIILVTIS